MVELTTHERLQKASIKLQSKNPFFSYLALFLKFNEIKKGKLRQDSVGISPTGDLYYCKEFIDSIKDDEELIGLLTHEIMHLAFLTQLRQGSRNPDGWNASTDLCINCLLKQNDFKLPFEETAPVPDRYDNWSFKKAGINIRDIDKKTSEQVYEELPKNIKQDMQGTYYLDSKGNVTDKDGNKIGNIKDAKKGGGANAGNTLGRGFDVHLKLKSKDGTGNLTEKEKQELKELWEDRVSTAYTSAKQKGDLPLGIDRLVKHLHREQVDWKSLLRKYITSFIPSDFSWARRNKKSISMGFYAPDTIKERIKVGVAIDTSGSIGDKELTDFLSEIIGMARGYKGQMDMKLYCHDVDVQAEYDVQNGDIEKIKKISMKGGGGTSHIPVMKHINENLKDCKAVIFFTDGYSDINEVKFKKNKFQSIFVITKDGNVEQLKGKPVQVIKLR